MRRVAGTFKVHDNNGNKVDEFVIIRDGNHGQFYNDATVIFDGDFYKGYRMFEKQKEDMTKFFQMIGNGYQVI